MKNLIIFFLIFTLFIALPEINFAQYNTVNDTRTLQLMYINCNYAKGKVIGEEIRIEVYVDGYDIINPIKKALKTGRIWDINYSYDYLDYVIIKFWDDNVFKDHLVGELRLEKDLLDQSKTVNFTGKDVSFDLHFKVVPGPGYRNIIMRLRESLSAVYNDLEILRKENERLEGEIDSLEYSNNELKKEIKKLKE